MRLFKTRRGLPYKIYFLFLPRYLGGSCKWQRKYSYTLPKLPLGTRSSRIVHPPGFEPGRRPDLGLRAYKARRLTITSWVGQNVYESARRDLNPQQPGYEPGTLTSWVTGGNKTSFCYPLAGVFLYLNYPLEKVKGIKQKVCCYAKESMVAFQFGAITRGRQLPTT